MRLDKFLYDYYQLKSRSYAEMLIKTGKVFVRGKVVLKPSFEVDPTCVQIRISEDEGYASQGAYKIEEAFRVFPISVEGKSTADIGCSNGGFTDYLLRRGAASVLAVDVAECSLPDRLKNDERVTFLQCNARALPKKLKKVDFVCSDVSFISLKLIMNSIYDIMHTEGECVLLVKPQFELTRDSLSKKGIVLDIRDREKALNSVIEKAKSIGFSVLDSTVSPIRYDNKNIEYLLYMKKPRKTKTKKAEQNAENPLLDEVHGDPLSDGKIGFEKVYDAQNLVEFKVLNPSLEAAKAKASIIKGRIQQKKEDKEI